MAHSPDHHCVIIGGGPAGLTCGLYFARFNCRPLVIYREDQRARLIPRTFNFPGHPDGITGDDLLARCEAQATKYGATLHRGKVIGVDGKKGEFKVRVAEGAVFSAGQIVLATGITDVSPQIPGIDKYVGHGLRHCPICDGFEADGERLAIIGVGDKVAQHALFLKTFTDDITILFNGECAPADIRPELRAQLKQQNIHCMESPVIEVIGEGREIRGFRFEDGASIEVDRAYSAIDVRPRTTIAGQMGVALNDRGFIEVDEFGRTNVDGVYAVGDVTSRGDAQNVIAMAQAATAAIHIHAQALSWNY